MLNITGTPHRLCDGLSRRDFLRVGAAGGFGLSLPLLLQARAAAEPAGARFGAAKRCVLLFLTGGPSQLDTWDMKPDAPAEVRGPFQPIATNVPGIRICELFPRLARHAEKYCIVRSVTHQDTVHTSAGYAMLTGVGHPQANAVSATEIRPRSNDHPHLGSIVARVRPDRPGMPHFVSMPEIIKDDQVNEFPGQGAGFLGKQYSPFLIEADTKSGVFSRPEIELPLRMDTRRLESRRLLLRDLDRTFRSAEAAPGVRDRDAVYQRAFSMIASAEARRAFDLDREPPGTREAYGRHLFGQGCLLARRLMEADVSLVTVYWHYEGPRDSPVWDTHGNNFPHLKDRLVPPTDQALSALLQDLDERGMLDDTLFICMGEFGRTPKINGAAGRDHWPHAQSILLAGAGIRGGSVCGATDRIAAYPEEDPVSPQDLAATVLHLLGVPRDLEIRDRTDRPYRACEGTPVHSLLT
jgi:hypothetical protein